MELPVLVLEPSTEKKKSKIKKTNNNKKNPPTSLLRSHVPNPKISNAVPTLIKKFIATFFTAGHAMSGADCYFNHWKLSVSLSLQKHEETSGYASKIDRHTDNYVIRRHPENRCWTGKTAKLDSGIPRTIVVRSAEISEQSSKEYNKNKWWQTRDCVCYLWERVFFAHAGSLPADTIAWHCAWCLCGRGGL